MWRVAETWRWLAGVGSGFYGTRVGASALCRTRSTAYETVTILGGTPAHRAPAPAATGATCGLPLGESFRVRVGGAAGRASSSVEEQTRLGGGAREEVALQLGSADTARLRGSVRVGGTMRVSWR